MQKTRSKNIIFPWRNFARNISRTMQDRPESEAVREICLASCERRLRYIFSMIKQYFCFGFSVHERYSMVVSYSFEFISVAYQPALWNGILWMQDRYKTCKTGPVLCLVLEHIENDFFWKIHFVRIVQYDHDNDFSNFPAYACSGHLGEKIRWTWPMKICLVSGICLASLSCVLYRRNR